MQRKKQLHFVALLVISFLFTITLSLQAQVPRTISFQGQLTNPDGSKLADGAVSLVFMLYESETGGTAIWTETQSVNVKNSLFSVILGKVKPLTAAFDKPYWVGIKINSGSELTPRLALTSSPYSLGSSATTINLGPGQNFQIKDSSGNVTHILSANGDFLSTGTGTFKKGLIVGNPTTSTVKTNNVKSGINAQIDGILFDVDVGNDRINLNAPVFLLPNTTPTQTNNGLRGLIYDPPTGRLGVSNTPWGTFDPPFDVRGPGGNDVIVVNAAPSDDPPVILPGGAQIGDGNVQNPLDILLPDNRTAVWGGPGDNIFSINDPSGNSSFSIRRGGHVHIRGNVFINGTLNKSQDNFMIDHPLDPLNKYLQHSVIESPDMMNIYNGNVVLDDDGEATIELPDWFEALNKDFRYQLTPIGVPALLYVSEEIDDNEFTIAGGKAGMKVSWQVTGIRHDPYANKNRTKVEVEKPIGEKGKYMNPDAYKKSVADNK
ncbi:MAG TPA: hypothetical protein ENI76_05470 [Ignavibacteria bacterium]|nr:hypothetical protein [Ignavibacteria bacterium]